MRAPAFVLAGVALLLAGCEPSGGGDPVDIGGRGAVIGTVFVDANASNSFDAGDTPAALFPISLVLAGTADTVARTQTDETGVFVFNDVLVGRYRIAVAPSALGDTMSVVFLDPPGAPATQVDPEDATFTVGAGDSVEVRIGVAYPVITVEAARTLPPGRRVFVAGVAVAGAGTAADSTVFVEGTTRGIAARRVVSGAGPGDSVLVFGVTATRDGQPVLTDASVQVRASELAFDTIPLVAVQAVNAGGGIHDARLVRLAELIVTDTTRTVGTSPRFIMTAEDPTGSVQVSIPVALRQPSYVPGFEFSVVGVLVPRTGIGGQWQVRPRSPDDIIERP